MPAVLSSEERATFLLSAHCSLPTFFCAPLSRSELWTFPTSTAARAIKVLCWVGAKHRALVLHGFPGTPAEMLPVAEILAEGGLEVHGPLLPGFGLDIERLGKTHWQDWVRAAQRAWDTVQTGAETTLLLGFSMGGAVALKLAAHPDRLVLLAPFSRLADPRARLLPVAQYVLPQLKPFQNADFTQEVVRSQFRRLEPTLNLDDPEVQRELREKVVAAYVVFGSVATGWPSRIPGCAEGHDAGPRASGPGRHHRLPCRHAPLG